MAVTPSGREGKVYLRKTEGIRDWYQCLKVKIYDMINPVSMQLHPCKSILVCNWFARIITTCICNKFQIIIGCIARFKRCNHVDKLHDLIKF